MVIKSNEKKNKKPPPFGSNTKRFGVISVHPNLDQFGLYTAREQGCDPGHYHPIPLHEAFQVNKNKTKDVWRCKTELEDWSKNLGYRSQHILAARNWAKTTMGPAWYDVYSPTAYEPACKNVGFGRALRFFPSKDYIPGPGTYYKATPYKAPHGPHSTRMTFIREEPCRFKDAVPKWSLAPDRYTLIDKNSIEQKSKKVVSKRGPYQLFTGKRDGSTIKNHFSTSLRCSATTWPLSLPGSLEKYKNSLFYTMNKTGRDKPHRGRNTLVDISMCLRSPTDPGPGHLNIDKPKKFPQNKAGFNSSYNKGRGYVRVVVWPGVGRYRPHAISCGVTGHGHKHVFLSKIGRTIGAVIQEPYNTF